MKMKFSLVLALAALLMSAGCQKSIHSPAATGTVTTTSRGSTSGIGGYNLTSINDRAIAFDYDGTGLTYILVYRPGSNLVSIMKNTNNTFTPVFSSTTGIGGYQLTSAPTNASDNYNEVGGDHIMAFDYDGSGHQDHLVCYRPGTGMVWILKNSNGVFSPIYQTTSGGIGGYDLRGPTDKIISFDYDHSGLRNYLILYRPGYGFIWIVKHSGATFSAVATSNSGIGGFDIHGPLDQVLALDYDGTGKMDHLVLYRPGSTPGNHAFWLVQHGAGTSFTAEFSTQSGVSSSFDLSQPQDRMFALDYTFTGAINSLFCYRPGIGLVAVYSPLFADNVHTFGLVKFTSGEGIGGYPFLNNPTASNNYVGDKAFAFDDLNHFGFSSVVAFAAGPQNWIDVLTVQNSIPGDYGAVF